MTDKLPQQQKVTLCYLIQVNVSPAAVLDNVAVNLS